MSKAKERIAMFILFDLFTRLAQNISRPFPFDVLRPTLEMIAEAKQYRILQLALPHFSEPTFAYLTPKAKVEARGIVRECMWDFINREIAE